MKQVVSHWGSIPEMKANDTLMLRAYLRTVEIRESSKFKKSQISSESEQNIVSRPFVSITDATRKRFADLHNYSSFRYIEPLYKIHGVQEESSFQEDEDFLGNQSSNHFGFLHPIFALGITIICVYLLFFLFGVRYLKRTNSKKEYLSRFRRGSFFGGDSTPRVVLNLERGAPLEDEVVSLLRHFQPYQHPSGASTYQSYLYPASNVISIKKFCKDLFFREETSSSDSEYDSCPRRKSFWPRKNTAIQTSDKNLSSMLKSASLVKHRDLTSCGCMGIQEICCDGHHKISETSSLLETCNITIPNLPSIEDEEPPLNIPEILPSIEPFNTLLTSYPGALALPKVSSSCFSQPEDMPLDLKEEVEKELNIVTQHPEGPIQETKLEESMYKRNPGEDSLMKTCSDMSGWSWDKKSVMEERPRLSYSDPTLSLSPS